MGIILEMMPQQITEALMTRLPDPKIVGDAYKETKYLIIQLMERKADFWGCCPDGLQFG